MNARQAKKRLKKKWNIPTLNKGIRDYRKFDRLYSFIQHELARRISFKFEEAILYGTHGGQS